MDIGSIHFDTDIESISPDTWEQSNLIIIAYF